MRTFFRTLAMAGAFWLLAGAAAAQIAPDNQGRLKVCKVAGSGVPVGTIFTINVNGVPVSVPAGPGPDGYCVVVSSTFAPGTIVPVDETLTNGNQLIGVTVKPLGTFWSPINNGVNVQIGNGVTEVTFTNKRTGYIEICKQKTWKGGPGTFTFYVNPGNLGPYTVPAGACSPAIEVPAGTVTITEVLFPGGHLTNCSTLPAGMQGPCALGPQISTVNVAPGNISNQTIVFMTNGPVHDPTNENNPASSTESQQQ